MDRETHPRALRESPPEGVYVTAETLDSQHGLEQRGESKPIDLDGIEMRWASEWNESDDGEVRVWRNDVAALIDEVRRLRRVSNDYFEEMVRRGESRG